MFLVNVKKYENDLGICFPKEVVDKLNITEDSVFEVHISKDEIVLKFKKKENNEQHYKYAEKFIDNLPD